MIFTYVISADIRADMIDVVDIDDIDTKIYLADTDNDTEILNHGVCVCVCVFSHRERL